MRVVRGAFIDQKILDDLESRETVEEIEDEKWISIDEVTVDLETVKMLQRNMVKHYDDATIPWYMDGYREDDKNELIVAFGADDGEGGRIFTLNRNDKDKIDEVVKYGVSKGIPKEQLNFYEIDF